MAGQRAAEVPSDVEALQERLGVTFDDPRLLELALTHRSYAFEEGGLDTNERLEFLGDAVLGVVVTDLIYHELPDDEEGQLAKLRAAAVKESALATIGRQIDLGRHVRLGKGETASGGADKDSILADTLEAVLGACYLDQGFGEVFTLVDRLFGDRLGELSTRGAALDYKTSLQELTAAEYDELPVYEVDEDGPDHEKTFTATVIVQGQVRGHGEGASKKKAEQAAAREAYRRLTTGRQTIERPTEQQT